MYILFLIVCLRKRPQKLCGTRPIQGLSNVRFGIYLINFLMIQSILINLRQPDLIYVTW